jgi:hypothetical protein
MRGRLLFNAIVHQYLIPGVQVGAKVRVDPKSGEVLDTYSVVRPVTSESGCLLCNRLISSAKLQDESVSEKERRQQRYIDEPEIVAQSPSTPLRLLRPPMIFSFTSPAFKIAGLPVPNLFREILVGGGERSPLYAWIAETMRSVWPQLVEMGIVTGRGDSGRDT